MMIQKLHSKIQIFVESLQKYTDRFWYAPLIGFLAALDNIIIIIPNDGILISSSMLRPQRWFLFSVSGAIGSTIGAIGLAALVEYQGMPLILDIYPGINETKTWSLSMNFFERYGLLLVFAVALTPFMQQPAVILASLANTPLAELAAIIFVGRFIKFLIMAYIGSHTPRLLDKFWGLKGELKDAGVNIKTDLP